MARSDYIKREDALNTFSNAFYGGLAAKIKSIPPADVAPVVRCKDCKYKADTIGDSWCDFHEFTILSDDDFCSYGERKDDDGQR